MPMWLAHAPRTKTRRSTVRRIFKSSSTGMCRSISSVSEPLNIPTCFARTSVAVKLPSGRRLARRIKPYQVGDLIQAKVHEGPFAGKFVDCQVERVRVDGAGKTLLDVAVTRADR